MKNFVFIAVFAIVTSIQSGSAGALTVKGAASCGVWIEDREKQKGRDITPAVVDISWLVGYLSGLASGAEIEFWKDPNGNTLDVESVLLWTDNYCRANPLKRVDDAAVLLFGERVKSIVAMRKKQK